VTARMTNEK